MRYLDAIDRIFSVHFQGNPFNIKVIQVYAPTSNPEEAEVERFYEDLQDLLEAPRPFRYDLNQIPYDYTVEVRNRFKGLDLIECLMHYGQRFVTLYRRQGSRPLARKRNAKKQNGCLKRPYK